jgi:hypothetical protein
MNIGVRVGDQFEWNRNGAIVQITAVRGRKVKFEVFGGLRYSEVFRSMVP